MKINCNKIFLILKIEKKEKEEKRGEMESVQYDGKYKISFIKNYVKYK